MTRLRFVYSRGRPCTHHSSTLRNRHTSNETHTWPELAIGLYEHLTGKNAEIIYTFEDMTIGVPSSTGDGAKTAPWHLDGTLRIHTRTHDGA